MAIDWTLTFQGFKTFLDPLASASWPIVIGAALFGFRKPIAGLMGRIKELKGWGAEAVLTDSPDQLRLEQASLESAVAAKEAPGAVPMINGTLPPPPDDVYSFFDHEFESRLNASVPGDIAVKLAWAIRARSVAEVGRLHEMNYRIIFGSQLQALKWLNSSGRAQLSSVELFYRTAANSEQWREIHKNRSFPDWWQFLINTGYVKLFPDVNPPEAELSPLGRQFLMWLTEVRASEWRPG